MQLERGLGNRDECGGAEAAQAVGGGDDDGVIVWHRIDVCWRLEIRDGRIVA